MPCGTNQGGRSTFNAESSLAIGSAHNDLNSRVSLDEEPNSQAFVEESAGIKGGARLLRSIFEARARTAWLEGGGRVCLLFPQLLSYLQH